jgi:hypothetical protein
MRKTRQRRRRGRRTRKGGVNNVANVAARLQGPRNTARRKMLINSLRQKYNSMQSDLAQAKRFPLSQSEFNSIQSRGRSGAFSSSSPS